MNIIKVRTTAKKDRYNAVINVEMSKHEFNIFSNNLSRLDIKFTKKYSGYKTMVAINHLVCDYFNVLRYQLESRSRKHKYTFIRSIAWYLMHKYSDEPLQHLADFYGRDHTTVLYHLKVLKNDMFTDYRHINTHVKLIEQSFLKLNKDESN